MLSRVVKSAARVQPPQRRAAVGAMRAFASDAADAGDNSKKHQQQQQPRRGAEGGKNNNLRFGAAPVEGGSEQRKFSFALKDKKGGDNRGKDAGAAERASSSSSQQSAQQSQAATGGANRKKFSFAPSVKAKEKEPALEVFAKPAYWDEDFPVGFDDSMKHEVEKLEVFADFTMLIDSSWQKLIHPLFDGSAIELTLNAPLEDFDERLFIDDKNTFDTKVVMEVPLTCFAGLTPEGLEFVKQLAGPRYQPNKKQLKLTEDRYATRVHNHKRLCDILRDLTQTASELAAAQTAEAQQ